MTGRNPAPSQIQAAKRGEAKRATVKKLTLAGLPVEEIAKATGLRETAVRTAQAATSALIAKALRNSHPVDDDGEVEFVAKLRSRGRTYAEIADLMGRSTKAVTQFCKRNGIA